MTFYGRAIALCVLALMLAGFAIYTSPGGSAYAWASGKCFAQDAPPVCHAPFFNSRHVKRRWFPMARRGF